MYTNGLRYAYELVEVQPIPLWVTFSNAVSKLQAPTSLFTEAWQKRHLSFELSKMSLQVELAVCSRQEVCWRQASKSRDFDMALKARGMHMNWHTSRETEVCI